MSEFLETKWEVQGMRKLADRTDALEQRYLLLERKLERKKQEETRKKNYVLLESGNRKEKNTKHWNKPYRDF